MSCEIQQTFTLVAHLGEDVPNCFREQLMIQNASEDLVLLRYVFRTTTIVILLLNDVALVDYLLDLSISYI